MKRVLRILTIGSLILFTLVLVNFVAAHERRTIGNGKYDVEVGWLNEPSVASQANGATIEIRPVGSEDAVTGVEKTLKVDIAAGGKNEGVFTLHTVPGKPALYVADYTPPVTGSYIFTFIGTIDGVNINEVFESGPGRFDDVITADEAAKTTPEPDDDQATAAATSAVVAPNAVSTEAIIAPAPTASVSTAPVTAPAAPNSDATVAIVIVAVVIILVAGGLIVLRRKA